MVKIKSIIIFLLCFSAFVLSAQTKEMEVEAADYFDAKDYVKAYDLYDKLLAKDPNNKDFKFRLAYTTLFYPEKKARAVELFEDLRNKDQSSEMEYYLAKAYHINYRFDEAIAQYDQFITDKGKKVSKEDKPFVDDATLGIANCENGKLLLAKKQRADIVNIGSPINTNELEGVPIISADESIMIYTYSGKKSKGGLRDDLLKPDPKEGVYHEDIFYSIRLNDSVWSEPKGIDVLNTNGNDAAVAISPDGSTLFLFISNNDAGDLYMSNLNGESWTRPTRLNKNVNSKEWEGSCSISSDGRFLYFASERLGGYGGRDLYVSEKVNGDWGPAKNLGPKINTPYNEDAPFVHPDGITLFFSSEGHKSIGGYDIMYSVKKENDWIEPISMGMPLNTTEDDRYYVINAMGNRGYFSSNRSGSGGKGNLDIYSVTPGILGDKPIIAMLKGSVFADDKPIEAKIEVLKKVSNEVVGPYFSNSKTGKYLMALTPGNGYKIKITVSGFEPIEEEVDIDKLEKFIEIKKDFYVYSPNYMNKKDQKSVKSILDSILNLNVVVNDPVVETKTVTPVDTIAKVKDSTVVKNVSPCKEIPLADLKALKGKSLNEPENYKKLLDLAGDYCLEGLLFKVQIGAYRHPENFKFDYLKNFGKAEINKYPDGITRFTQLKFNTIKEAEAARQKIIESGRPDAWITAFVNGKRYTLEELIMVDFLGKAVN